MPRKGDRMVITLECTECGSRGYVSSKSRRNDPDRMELNKFCRSCRSHKLHRETR
ncbi:MAG: 50S ribosomal protein L33 [Chloroflexi bacterium]|nr:50S ribosomal protein L33 [Chloroflexota bacterium]HCU73280.1 50S ribosomal protein L33 [Chloroflexota bacterium]